MTNAELNASDREIVTSRVFDAPRTRVFGAWADPEHLKNWWGPTGFTNTFHQFDFRPGGHWRFVMYGPDGVDYKNESVFVEIVSPERIVLDHISPPRFRIEAVFGERDGKTELTFRMLFNTVVECARIKKYASDANEQNMDRLEVELARLA